MSREQVTVTELTCDGCGKIELVSESGEMPDPWYHGTVILHHAGDGSGDEWDACSKKCVPKAIEAAVSGEIERRWREAHS